MWSCTYVVRLQVGLSWQIKGLYSAGRSPHRGSLPVASYRCAKLPMHISDSTRDGSQPLLLPSTQ